jgi:ATP-dependent DNA ligase
VPLVVRPKPLVRIPKPFDHPAWIYEIKHDGFRALAHVEGCECRLLATRPRLPDVGCGVSEIAHSVRCRDVILDGELVCLDACGRQRRQGIRSRSSASSCAHRERSVNRPTIECQQASMTSYCLPQFCCSSTTSVALPIAAIVCASV